MWISFFNAANSSVYTSELQPRRVYSEGMSSEIPDSEQPHPSEPISSPGIPLLRNQIDVPIGLIDLTATEYPAFSSNLVFNDWNLTTISHNDHEETLSSSGTNEQPPNSPQNSSQTFWWGNEELLPYELPYAPPGSPLALSEELDGPGSYVDAYREQFLSQQPRQLLLGGSMMPPEVQTLEAPVILPEHSTPNFDDMPSLDLISASSDSDFSDSDSSDEPEAYNPPPTYRRPNLPNSASNGHESDDYTPMPGLMSVSESSDDEVVDESDSSGSEDDVEGARPLRNPLGYMRDPWATPGSLLHRALSQGQMPQEIDDTDDWRSQLANQLLPFLLSGDPESIPQTEAGGTMVDAEVARTAVATWRKERMDKLMGSLEIIDGPLLDRFCQVGGGGGEHHDECMICWESLKTEPEGASEKVQADNAPLMDAVTDDSDSLATNAVDVAGVAALPCLHAFHSRCLAPWFKRLFTTCPVCRFDLDPQRLLSRLPTGGISFHGLGHWSDVRRRILEVQELDPAIQRIERLTAHAVAQLAGTSSTVMEELDQQQTNETLSNQDPLIQEGRGTRRRILDERERGPLNGFLLGVRHVPSSTSEFQERLQSTSDRITQSPQPLPARRIPEVERLMEGLDSLRTSLNGVYGSWLNPDLGLWTANVSPSMLTGGESRSQREWVLPNGPAPGGIAGWVNKKEEERRKKIASDTLSQML